MKTRKSNPWRQGRGLWALTRETLVCKDKKGHEGPKAQRVKKIEEVWKEREPKLRVQTGSPPLGSESLRKNLKMLSKTWTV